MNGGACALELRKAGFGVMALAYSKGMALGTPAPPFSLAGIDGQTHSLESFADSEVLVVVFTCNHCPYAKAVESRLGELQRDYQDRGVALVAINPNDAVAYPDDSMEAMKVRAEQRGFNFPYLRDDSQEVARAYDAACTPGHLRLRWRPQAGLQRPPRRQLEGTRRRPAPGPQTGPRCPAGRKIT